MAIVTPKVDHVVIDTRNRIDEAVTTYRSLGFQLTDRGRHTLGSVNHLAVFESDYMELLGFDDTSGAVRADTLRFPVGLNGLVFATDNPEGLFGDLRERGLAAEQPIAFSRPVAIANRIEDAKFRVVRLAAGAVSFGRVYFCHHLTPKLVWRPEWGRHPNGRQTYGDSLIVDYWGVVTARLSSGNGVVVAELDLEAQEQARRNFPALTHRVL